ncbi:PAAR domain-containing protein [Intestinirhabdus alba]|uniref:PAAR domain-containing protein n=1 Tax=Intestinirhabdus alba TaxID=2899544 RepID=A0A6L6IPR3_9ENTR|nr:PAAR domain-containing protein [Intestinirhabdus alba]MTH48852.1 PAAR domain-containing protein [Intestinirhabdus alba]
MSRGNYLVVGDKTSCGGVIVEGDVTQTIMGKAAAREGDKVTCGKFPGVFYISGGMVNDMVNGRKMAGTLESRSTCPCQSRFIPSMLNDTYES